MSRLPILPEVESDGSGVYSPLYGSVNEPSLEREEYIARTGPQQSTTRHRVVLILVFTVLVFERIGYDSLNFRIDQIVYLSDRNGTESNETYHNGSEPHPRKHHSLDGWFLIFGVRAGGQFLFPLIGAWIGECVLGVHTTAVLGTVLEIMGSLFLLTFTMNSNSTDVVEMTDLLRAEATVHHQLQDSFILTGMSLVMLGLALTRSNYLILAASQIPEKRLQESGFFRWYLVAINVGPALAGALNYVPVAVQAALWPSCFMVSLLLLAVVKCISYDNINKPSMRGYGKLREILGCGGSLTEDEEPLYKHIIKLILFVCTNIPYFFIYASFNAPPSHVMGVSIGRQLYEPLTTISLVLIAQYVIIPVYKRYYSSSEQLKLIFSGKFLIILACFVAIIQTKFIVHKSPALDMATLFPQYFILGISEIVLYAKALEFIYLETPKYMKNQMLGLYLTAIGLGYSMRLATDIATDSLEHWQVDARVVVLSVAGSLQVAVLVPVLFFIRDYRYRSEYERSISRTVDGSRPQRWFGGSSLEDSGEIL